MKFQDALRLADQPFWQGVNLHVALQGKRPGDYIIYRDNDGRFEMFIVDEDAVFFATWMVKPTCAADLFVSAEIAACFVGDTVWCRSDGKLSVFAEVDADPDRPVWLMYRGEIAGAIWPTADFMAEMTQCRTCGGTGFVIGGDPGVSVGAVPCTECEGAGTLSGGEVLCTFPWGLLDEYAFSDSQFPPKIVDQHLSGCESCRDDLIVLLLGLDMTLDANNQKVPMDLGLPGVN